MKLGPLHRGGEIRARKVGDDRTLELSFSSETPVDRWFGREILLHGKGADFARLNEGAPLLFNHNLDDLRGVVERAWIGKDKRGHAVVRFASTEEGQKAMDLVNDGVLRNVSFMYRIKAWEMHAEQDDEPEDREYRVTEWEALEVSLVTVPADNTVGVGRGLRAFDVEPHEVRIANTRTEAMDATQETQQQKPPAAPEVRVEAGVDRQRMGEIARQTEQTRQDSIRNAGKTFKLDEGLVRQWIEDGSSLNQVMDSIGEIQRMREADKPTAATFLDAPKKDVRRYSLMRAFRAIRSNNWKDAGLELEMTRAVSDKTGLLPRGANSFFVPLDVQLRDLPRTATRDMTAAGASGSQYLVSTNNQPGSFIELLRNSSVSVAMGVTRLPGLVGNVTIPKMTAGNTGYWLADENTAITESQPTIGQLALAPKNVAALTEISHQLMQQSTPEAEMLVMSSIARDLGLAVDVGVLRGSGSSGQPTGIVNTASIGSVSGTSLAAAGVLEFQSDVASANALMPGCGYVTTPVVAADMMITPELPSTGTTRLWQGNLMEGSMFGFRAMTSNQMSAATMLFGWWPSVVLAEWGVLELMVNPYSDFTRGLSAVRGWYTVDVGVRYAGAWSYASSIT